MEMWRINVVKVANNKRLTMQNNIQIMFLIYTMKKLTLSTNGLSRQVHQVKCSILEKRLSYSQGL